MPTVIVATMTTAAIHETVRRLTAGRRCTVILGGRVFI
jgi:hypothetical protein